MQKFCALLNRPATWVAPAIALFAMVSALAALAILEIVQYPHPVWRGLVFHYLLFRQDLLGLGLLVAIALFACIPATHAPALKLVDAIGRRPGLVALATFVALSAGTLYLSHGHALAGDEHLALLQSRIFAEGRLSGQWPSDLLPWLVSDYYRYRWVMVDAATGDIAAIYWPGWAMLLTPFSFAGIGWGCSHAVVYL